MKVILPGVIGLALFTAFIGFLALRIGSAPLLVVVGLTLAMAVIDLVQSIREPE